MSPNATPRQTRENAPTIACYFGKIGLTHRRDGRATSDFRGLTRHPDEISPAKVLSAVPPLRPSAEVSRVFRVTLFLA